MRIWRVRRFAAAALLAAGLALPAAGDPPIVPPATPAPRDFADWQLDCSRACRIVSTLRSTQPGAPELVRLSVAPDPSGGWGLTIRTPLPLSLPDGLVLTPDQTDPRNLAWFTCTATGCEARIPLDADLLAALRRQRRATVELTLVDGGKVRLPLSLRGFSAAFGALKLSHAP